MEFFFYFKEEPLIGAPWVSLARGNQLKKVWKAIVGSEVDWITTSFLFGVPIFCLIALPVYYWNGGGPWYTLLLAAVLGVASNLSITVGYHRLFSHRSFEAHPVAKLILLFVGASAWQGTCLKWCSDHRLHHTFVDQDKDPYSIQRGFFYAHFGWMLLKNPKDRILHAPDLEKEMMVRIQHRYYVPIAITSGFIMPALIASLWGDFWGGLLIGGFLKTILTQHSTFLVNSLSHTLGRQPYSLDISARDSLFVSFLTHGEGYHNFHHRFQTDYRNGINWWQWDPTKWTIWTLSQVGLAHKLRKISAHEILKARLQVDTYRLKAKGFSDEKLEHVRERILAAQMKMKELTEQYKQIKSQFSAESTERIEKLRLEIEIARLEFQWGLKQWSLWKSARVPV